MKSLKEIAKKTAKRFEKAFRVFVSGFANAWRKIRHIIHLFFLGFLRCVYKVYSVIYNEITTPIKIIVLIVVISLNLIIWKVVPGYKFWGAVVSLGVYIFLSFIFLLIHFLINHVMLPSGSKSAFSASDFFKPIKENKVFEIKNPDSDNEFSIIPATGDEIGKIAELNKKAFHRTIWDTGQEQKFQRNSAHFKKNNLCFFSIKNINEIVGFTHIIPINKSTWDKYKAGKISDIGFGDYFIVPPQKQAIDDTPFGLLIFTIAITENIDKFKNDPAKSYGRQRGDLLTKAIVIHVNKFCESIFVNQRIVPIMFQAMNDNIIQIFKDMKTNGVEFSKDGARVICFDVLNSHFIPLDK